MFNKFLLLTYLSLFLNTNVTLLAQKFQPFIETEHNESIPDIIHLPENNQYIYIYNQFHETDNSSKVISTIRLINENHSFIKEITVPQFPDTISIATHLIPIPSTTELMIIGSLRSTLIDSELRQFFILHVDEQLNILHQSTFAHSDSMAIVSNGIVNHKGNLVVIGAYLNFFGPSFCAEYTLDGEVKHVTDFPSNLVTSVIQLADSTYRVLSFNWLFQFDEQLQLMDPINVPQFDPNSVSKNITHNQFLVAGLQRYDDFQVFMNFEKDILYRFNTLGEWEAVYEFEYPDRPNLFKAYHGLDFIDTNYIYFMSNKEPCLGIDCNSYISLYNVQSNGNLNWKKELGGDAEYQALHVVATPDKGCLIIALHIDEAINPNREASVYFLKLDKDGNTQDIFTDIPSSPLATPEVLLYPNPATTHLCVDWQHPQAGTMDLYSATGQLVLQTTINDGETTTIAHLSTGTYFYILMDEQGRLVQKGQLVKQ